MLGKDVNLGRHVSEEAAAKAYDKAAICARGKHAAKLNFSLNDYSSNRLPMFCSTSKLALIQGN